VEKTTALATTIPAITTTVAQTAETTAPSTAVLTMALFSTAEVTYRYSEAVYTVESTFTATPVTTNKAVTELLSSTEAAIKWCSESQRRRCRNGASCVYNISSNTASCVCAPGFTDASCSTG